MPTTDRLREELEYEWAKLANRQKKWVAPNAVTPMTSVPSTDTWQPRANIGLPIQDTTVEAQPFIEEAQWQPSVQIAQPVTEKPVIETPTVSLPEEKKLAVPFWQRALQVFTAPFEWVDENVIKPTLAVGASAVGLEQVERLPGEDYFDWKKRGWENWEAPGIDIKVPWGDGDVRIDIKGVMEFAPWLLIPGAGQVGSGVRGAAGVAGILGKMGKAGKVLGTAVEYSPWGLVEKGAGAVIRGATKGAAKISGKAGEKVFGKIEPKPISEDAQEFTNFFDKSVISRYTEFQKSKPLANARREAITRDIFAKQRRGEITGEEAIAQSLKELKGTGTKADFSIPSWEREDIRKRTKGLLDEMVAANERGLVNLDDSVSLLELLAEGTIPQPHNIKAFARVFGAKFAESVSQLQGVKRSRLDSFIDLFNIPRSVLASGDISAVARQGLILGLAHPSKVPRSMVRMFKSLFSEKLALEADDVMRADPLFNEFVQVAKGYIAPIGKGAVLSKAEESFASKAAESIPFVRRSERAFITYLNELRFGSYKAASAAVKGRGGGDKELESLGRFINLASGRGDLPKSLDKFAPLFNTILFSPRLQAATLELPVQLGRMFMSKNPYMRKEAAKALVTFAGGGTALLLLLKNSGIAKVEADPRGGDFGKIIIGKTRLDIWRGYLQYARFAAQMLTGQSKSASGNMSTKDRFDTAFRFLQSKSSPAFGLMVDMLKGENYMGDPLFEGTSGTAKMVKDRMMPLALQDIMDAMEQGGINGLWTAAPAMTGIGTLTYVDEFVKTKDKIAKTMGFETWDEIDPKTQREIWNRSVELQAAQIQFDRRVMDTAWGDWRLAGNAVEDVFRQNIDQATEQYRVMGDGYNYKERIKDAFTARRGGYDARDKEPRFSEIVERNKIQDTAEAMVALSPEQMAIRTYNDALYGDDMYDQFGEYRFDEAKKRKELLKQTLGEMYQYVEDYQGVKYETFPPEFQEYQKAKEVLAPYWAVQDKIIKMFGTAFAESPRGKALITKLRKQMRLSDPQMEYYFTKFYVQSQ